MKTEHTIDAAGKSLGRVAAEAAKHLMGKTSADYTPHVRSDVKVTIINAAKISMRAKKRNAKIYTSYSGYPGGLKRESLSALAARRGAAEPVRRAVERMLPRNTFRNARMKNLSITA